MEKKKSPTQLGIAGSFALYRDDLDEIVAKLTETCKQVIIEDNKYRYDSLDDLFDKQGPHPNQLSINSRDPLVIFNVRIKPRYTTLGTSGDGDNLAPYFSVKEILESKKRGGLGAFLNSPLSTLLFFLLVIIVLFIPGLGSPVLTLIRWLFLFVMLVSSVTLQMLYDRGAFTTISLKKKHEEGSFWTKNKDTIIIAIITNVITALLSFTVAYLLFRQGIK
jgi:hypothetical protein